MPRSTPFRPIQHAPDLTPPLREPWMDDALCIQIGDPDLWFGESMTFLTDDDGRRQSAAKTICSRCPVRVTCLEGALQRNERYGIWGGLTPDERLRHKRRSA